jgi:predicted enzyme related to lactoylglutathione lyase
MGNPVVHFEIMGIDVARLQRFYHDAFEWEIGPPSPGIGIAYSMVYPRGEGTINGGIGASSNGYDGHVTFYIQVSDIDAALAKVVGLGARVMMPPSEVPGGPKLALIHDPEGHVVGLIQARASGP